VSAQLEASKPAPQVVNNLSKAGWRWGCVATIDREGRTIWIVDAHCGNGKRFVVHADEKLTAFLKLERAICLQLLVNKFRIAAHRR
jgi:hypothetical protein